MKNPLIFDCRMINNSGIGTYVAELLIYFLSIEGMLLKLIVNNESRKKVEEILRSKNNKVDVIYFRSQPFTLLEQWEYFFKIPKKLKVFIPHINIPFFVKRKSLYVTIHDTFHLANPQYYSKIAIYFFSFIFKMIKRNAKEIITVSEFSRSEILKFLNIKDNSVHVIYNGCKKFDQNDDVDIDRTIIDKVQEFDKIILFVGNVKPHKNLLFLIDCFNKLEREDVLLLIVGKKDGFFISENFNSCIYKNIYFTGFVNDSTLNYIYKNSNFLVFPSKYEGFGLPILEAMYFNKNIIASNISVFTELFGDSINYFEIEDENSLITEMKKMLNPEFTDENNYNSILQKFSWKKSAKKHLEILLK